MEDPKTPKSCGEVMISHPKWWRSDILLFSDHTSSMKHHLTETREHNFENYNVVLSSHFRFPIHLRSKWENMCQPWPFSRMLSDRSLFIHTTRWLVWKTGLISCWGADHKPLSFCLPPVVLWTAPSICPNLHCSCSIFLSLVDLYEIRKERESSSDIREGNLLAGLDFPVCSSAVWVGGKWVSEWVGEWRFCQSQSASEAIFRTWIYIHNLFSPWWWFLMNERNLLPAPTTEGNLLPKETYYRETMPCSFRQVAGIFYNFYVQSHRHGHTKAFDNAVNEYRIFNISCT